INVGGPAYSATNGITYIADRYYSGGELTDWSWVGDVINTKDDEIYFSERWGDFQYHIPMVNGSYDVVLQFSELNWTSVGDRKIIASIEGVSMLRDFDIYKSVGNGVALDLSFGNIQVKDGALNIQMTASADAGTLSGIVVKRSAIASSVSGSNDLISPAMPGGVAYTSLTDRSVTLKWNSSTDNVGVVGYYVYRDGAPVGYVNAQTTSYVDQSVSSDTSYSYAVVAVDAAGNQSASTSLAVKTYVLAGALTISWDAPTQRPTGELIARTDIGGYVVRYKLRAANTYTSVTLPASVFTFTSAKLVGDYDFEIASFDVNGVYSEYVKISVQ
ncbi:MAG TPA: malectin domain-containing carbohydrate-binding protein, partial [Cellvibrionaceae bacterium]|nr:malectin domain-containing carbohydrate-binding protein [Cellvibrionaceae bacterium]